MMSVVHRPLGRARNYMQANGMPFLAVANGSDSTGVDAERTGNGVDWTDTCVDEVDRGEGKYAEERGQEDLG